MKIVYIVRCGYNYEHDHIFGVFASKYKAKKAIKEDLEKYKDEKSLLHFYNEALNGYINIENYEVK
jgi:hypothetical protein